MALKREQRTMLEKMYGCTLMVYVQTPDFWFAFHIGDGKMIAYKIVNGKVQWKEPVPWDDRCFLNKTTSLCDSDALNEFRFCYQGNGEFPDAVFLGSDGLDDSFGEETNLVNFYIQVIKMLATDDEDIEITRKSLRETLPQLSKIGSKDDMSIATVFNLEKLKANIQLFVDWQRELVSSRIDEINLRIDGLKDKRDKIKKSGKTDNNSVIELNYAIKDLNRARTDRNDLIKKYDILADELGDSHYPIPDDEESKENPEKDEIPSIEAAEQIDSSNPLKGSDVNSVDMDKEHTPETDASTEKVQSSGVEDGASPCMSTKDHKSYPRNIPVTGDSNEVNE